MQNGGAFVVIADNTFESDIVLAHMNMVCSTAKFSHFHTASNNKQQQHRPSKRRETRSRQ